MSQTALVASLIDHLRQAFPNSESLNPTIQSLLKLYNFTEKDLEQEFLPFSIEDIFREGVKIMNEKEEEENSSMYFKFNGTLFNKN